MNKLKNQELSQDSLRQLLNVVTDKAMVGDEVKEQGKGVSITRGMVVPENAQPQMLTIERHFEQPLQASILQMEQEVSGDILTRTYEIKQIQDHLNIACREITIAAFDEPYQVAGGVTSETSHIVTESELATLNTLVSSSYPEPFRRGVQIHHL